MRTQWTAIPADLTRRTRAPGARRHFDSLRCHPTLARFADAAALVAFLDDRAGSLDEKNEIYRALIATARARLASSPLAIELLWLGLWPALDCIHRRFVRHAIRARVDLVSLLAVTFGEVVMRLRVGHCRRVAATVVRNTRRELWRALRQERQAAEAQRLELSMTSARIRHLACGVAAVDSPQLVRLAILDLLGADDANLLANVVVLRTPLSEIAHATGIAKHTLRRRLARARKKNARPEKKAAQKPHPKAHVDLAEVVDVNAPQGAGARIVASRAQPSVVADRAAVPDHVAGTACLVIGDLAPGAICPRCLHDIFLVDERTIS